VILGITITIVQLWLLNCAMSYSAYLGMTSGAFSIAYVAFIGLGAYTAGILSTEHGFSIVENLLVAPVLCAIVALILVRPLERLSGVYLAVASVGIVALFQVLLYNLEGITKGAAGIPNIPLSVGTWALAVAVVVMAFLTRQLERSDLGRAIRMTRLDPIVAVSLGVNVRRTRLLLFVASAFVGGIAGVLRAHYFGYVSPESYSFDLVVLLLAMVVIGGIGSWIGPIVGAAIFTLLPEWLQSFGVWRDLVTGALLLIIVVLTREGLVGASRYGWYRLRRRMAYRDASVPALAGAGAAAPLEWSQHDDEAPPEPGPVSRRLDAEEF
jgi:branched-chain amino acid transport system permease protein